MASVFDVAKYIIASNKDIDNLKLNKLLYYSQAIYMILNKKERLFNSPIEAWQYGPVISEIYHEYKKYGNDNIPCDLGDTKGTLSKKELEAIDMVLDYYGNLSGIDLMLKTHQETPWSETYEKNTSNKEISLDKIYNYFNENIKFSDEA